MKRLLSLFFGVIAVFALTAVVLVLRQPKPFVSGPLKLPDGEIVRIIGTTYGTNHVLGTPLARAVARMSAVPQALLRRVLGSRAPPECATITFEPRLIVWLRRTTNAPGLGGTSGYLTATLSDASGFLSGEQAFIEGGPTNPRDIQFRVFPRRDPLITLNFFYHAPTGGVVRCGSLPLAHPCPGDYPQWQPVPLPVTRQVGGVAVTLDKLSTGHDESTSIKGLRGGGRMIEFGTNRLNGRNTTVCAVKLRSLTNTNEVWLVTNEEASDATGNRAGNTSIGWGSYEDGYFTFEPGLWPAESAWKLRCEIKRAEGFAPTEMFSFEHVPLGRLDVTNRIGWSTNFGGISVTLNHILRRAPNTNNSWSSKDVSNVQFTTAGLTNGLYFDLLTARTDTGKKLQSGSWSSDGRQRNYTFREIPLDATSVSFTFAVQRSRWVEFMVKPEAGPLALEYKPTRRN